MDRRLFWERNRISCAHRMVSKDGRVVCAKIVEGENGVSDEQCRACPYQAVNCRHLRFVLRQRGRSALVVRHNGRMEVWDDGPAVVELDRAACAARVMAVEQAGACAGCGLRQAAEERSGVAVVRGRAGAVSPVGSLPDGEPAVRCRGKVVPFAVRGSVAATG